MSASPHEQCPFSLCVHDSCVVCVCVCVCVCVSRHVLKFDMQDRVYTYLNEDNSITNQEGLQTPIIIILLVHIPEE